MFLVSFCEVQHSLLSVKSSDLSRFIPPINTHWTHQRYRMITVGNGAPEDAQDDKPRHPESLNASIEAEPNYSTSVEKYNRNTKSHGHPALQK